MENDKYKIIDHYIGFIPNNKEVEIMAKRGRPRKTKSAKTRKNNSLKKELARYRYLIDLAMKK